MMKKSTEDEEESGGGENSKQTFVRVPAETVEAEKTENDQKVSCLIFWKMKS